MIWLSVFRTCESELAGNDVDVGVSVVIIVVFFDRDIGFRVG